MVHPSVDDVQRAVGDRYEVLDLAGAGGMGAVFRARHRTLGHVVAIKVLPPEVASSRMRQERFRREASLAAHLSHPNLVPVYEFDLREGICFLVMPFVRGVTLESVLDSRGRLETEVVLRVVREVGAALAFAHQHGVVHRDVKPSNIMIEEDTGRALLTDFGVAHVDRPTDGSLTAPGTPIGTPDYMAPEQLGGDDSVDGRADLYALALVAFEALTGTLPAIRTDRAALARALRAAQAGMPPLLATALVAPLAERPGDRPAAAGAWLELIGRGLQERRTRLLQATLAGAGLVVAGWLGYHALRPAPPGARTLAVMPVAVLGTNPNLPPGQLPTWFIQRLGAVPHLAVVSPSRVSALAGGEWRGVSDAESLAVQLQATYWVQPSVELAGTRVKLTAQLYETKTGKLLGMGEHEGSADSLSEVMDAVWSEVLPHVVRENFARTSAVTLPHTLDALRAYATAEEAFRRGDFADALAAYSRVIAADSSFAIAYFRRALVVAQIDPSQENLQSALAGARLHQTGLSPADSLLLAGYRLVLERGDGPAALERFKAAADLAPDQPQVWFVLGEFYYHFGLLFDQDIGEAEAAFNRVRDLVPSFAPAIAHLISLAHLREDRELTARLIREYEAFGTTSVVAEAVGIADTLLLQSFAAQAALLKNIGAHSFIALEYLAFQGAEFGTDAERRGPARRILNALERKAVTDSQRVVALRFGVAADLREGWLDSARLRLDRATQPAPAAERDMWVLVAQAAGLPALGDWRSAGQRVSPRAAGAAQHWALARIGVDRARHVAALRRLASDSAPLPLSLALDLDAQRSLAAGDTATALALWDRATRRYAVLRVPFDLVASLWPLRLEMARVAVAHGDSGLARRACDSFGVLMGYVDQVARPEADRLCRR